MHMEKKKALITGITGQDGSYLAELLLAKGYDVHGLIRYVSSEDPTARLQRISHLVRDKRITLHWGSVYDCPTLWKIITRIEPNEIYHLAALSSIQACYDDEFGGFRTNFESTRLFLSIIHEVKPDTKFYFAGSSEMFGRPEVSPQDETTPLNPVSPYAIAKTAGFHLVKMYRETHGMFSCSGIAYNHESSRRGLEFVTRKITSTAAKIKLGIEKELRMGNLDAARDWGFAGDYVEAMWRILQHETPDDYVIGTGESHTVQEFAERAFGSLGLDWQQYVIIDKVFVRPRENFEFRANSTKIRRVLGWQPNTDFKALVAMMTEADLKSFTHPQ